MVEAGGGRGRSGTGKGGLPGEAFKQDQTEGIDVAGSGRTKAFRLLGTEVGSGADGLARGSQMRIFYEAGDTEIREFGLLGPAGVAAGTNEDVARFHVAMDYTLVMDICQSLGHSAAQRLRFTFSEWRMGIGAAEVLAGDQFHHEVRPVMDVFLINADVEYSHQIGVVQAGQYSRFGLLPGLVIRSDRPGVENLDCYVPAQYFVPSLMD
ncbi:hypothetical protein GCM10027403_11350 [Arthrobacter tecti]